MNTSSSAINHKYDLGLDEFAEYNEMRSLNYGLLSRLYRIEVDKEFLDSLKETRFPVETGSELIDKGYHLIVSYLNKVRKNPLEDLAIDYTRVFIGSGIDSYSAAYPYESVYTSEKRLLMQTARDEVLALYRSEGLEKQISWKESEDHIAVEFEFMQILCNRIVEEAKCGDEASVCSLLATQKSFLADHICSWVSAMTADMKRFSKTIFYKGVAYLTEGFIEADSDFLKSAMAETDG